MCTRQFHQSPHPHHTSHIHSAGGRHECFPRACTHQLETHCWRQGWSPRPLPWVHAASCTSPWRSLPACRSPHGAPGPGEPPPLCPHFAAERPPAETAPLRERKWGHHSQRPHTVTQTPAACPRHPALYSLTGEGGSWPHKKECRPNDNQGHAHGGLTIPR